MMRHDAMSEAARQQLHVYFRGRQIDEQLEGSTPGVRLPWTSLSMVLRFTSDMNRLSYRSAQEARCPAGRLTY